ncbi:MAG: autotransporter domain-containing protein [Holosporales bacterium]
MVFFLVAVLMLLAASGEARAACPSPGTFASLTLTSGDVDCGPYTLTGTASIADGARISPAANNNGLTVTGTFITITNNGVIQGNGSSGAILIESTANVSSFSNNNTIITAGNGTSILLKDDSFIDDFFNTGTVTSNTGSALRLEGNSSILYNSSVSPGAPTLYIGGITGNFTSSGSSNATVVLNTTASTLFNVGSDIKNQATGGVALSITRAPTGNVIINLGTITSGTGTNAAAVRFDANGINFTNNGTINGRIIDSGNEDITLNNSGTITGAVVLDGNAEHTLTLSSGTITGGYTGGEDVDTLNLNGGAITGAINLGANITDSTKRDVLIVGGTFTTGGMIKATAIDTSGPAEVKGIIDLTVGDTENGYFTVNHAVNLETGNITVNPGSTLNIGTGNLASTGTLQNSGTIMIAPGQSLTASTVAPSGLGSLSIGVRAAVGANPASAGKLVLAGGGVDLDGATVAVAVDGNSGFIPVGTTFTIIDANGALTGALPTDVTSNSILYKFSLSKNAGDIVLTTTGSVASIATNPNNANVANTLLNLGAITDATLAQTQNNLTNATNSAAANRVLESTLPTMDGGVSQSAFNVNNQVQGITTGRLEHIREGFNNRSGSIIRQNSFASSLSQSVRSDDSVGFSNASYNTVAANSDIRAMLGNNETRVSVSDNVWLQGFGQKATQNTRDFIQGYDATTYGIIMGADTHEIFDSGTVGIAFNYGKAKIDSKNAADARNNVDSYGVIVYGTHPVTETVFFDGQLGYNFNQIDSTRNNVGGTGLTAKANYGANQYSARGLVGKDYQVGSGFMVTPTVSLTYTRLAVQGFTETGANGVNLKVNSSEYNILDLGLGVRAERVFTTASGMQIRPSAHAGYRYDMIGDKIQTTSTFTGGGPAFTTTGGEAQKSKFNIGGGIGVGTLHDWQLSAEYDYEIQTDYSAHSGFLRASSPF